MFDLDTYRLFSDVLLQYACGLHGRAENDPVYQRVTEGRDVGKMQASYSSCGDLAHWLHFRLGIRCSWVNRAEGSGWRMGQNVSRLAYAKVAEAPGALNVFGGCGDVGIIWNSLQGTDAHVLLVRVVLGATEIATAEYGQPGGALKTRTLKDGKLGSRKLQRVIRLGASIETARSAGLLVAPDKATILDACAYLENELSGEILDQIESTLAPI